ncbi:MAG: SMP-30/gluconolactonase/LRE family protein [Acidimicrobiales bacterium]|nr:SMP-30/gluconolactonase/LRE family protein [Acidimicrobiales bacterium]
MTAPEVVAEGLVYAECPRWRDGALYVSDILGQRVVAVGPDGSLTEVVELDDRPAGLGWLPDGRLLVASMRRRQLVCPEPGGVSLHADLASIAPHEINDMVVAPDGTAYVSQFGFDLLGGQERTTTGLIRVSPDRVATEVASGLAFPNGVALAGDGVSLLVAESDAGRITRYRVDSNGQLGDRQVFADLGQRPDGICTDASGAVWVACVQAGRFVRVEASGTVSQTIELEQGRRAVACVLGDDDRRTLYLCTAGRRHLSDRALPRRGAG